MIDEACRTLHLPTIRSRWEEIASTALQERTSYKDFLADLLEAECLQHEERKTRLVREATSPAPSGWRTSSSRKVRTCPPTRSAPWPTQPG
ncbi:ATP-binding protein [Streptomyces sp. NPDC006430]|uniref:ATP-binding protein n=1 Tax=Streptomyces sp. NPDC006430 TaxID=3154299 RepID=UPI00339DD24C